MLSWVWNEREDKKLSEFKATTGDPTLASHCQVIASAPSFPKAIQKMQRALAEFQVWSHTCDAPLPCKRLASAMQPKPLTKLCSLWPFSLLLHT